MSSNADSGCRISGSCFVLFGLFKPCVRTNLEKKNQLQKQQQQQWRDNNFSSSSSSSSSSSGGGGGGGGEVKLTPSQCHMCMYVRANVCACMCVYVCLSGTLDEQEKTKQGWGTCKYNTAMMLIVGIVHPTKRPEVCCGCCLAHLQ